MKAFWVPSKAPDARTVLDKPDSNTFCPASGKKLKLKDLIPVKFTRVPEEESGLHMDPVTKDNFTNSSALILLRPTGLTALLTCDAVSSSDAASPHSHVACLCNTLT